MKEKDFDGGIQHKERERECGGVFKQGRGSGGGEELTAWKGRAGTGMEGIIYRGRGREGGREGVKREVLKGRLNNTRFCSIRS